MPAFGAGMLDGDGRQRQDCRDREDEDRTICAFRCFALVTGSIAEWERKFPLSSSAAKRFLLTSLESLDKKREEGILSPQEQEHKYCLSTELTKLLQKIRSLQIEYQSWWKKEQLSGLKINFHKSELFCYGAAKDSLAMFMFSFFECFATVANNVRFRSNYVNWTQISSKMKDPV
ncbi:hypothetical protein ACJX0J_038838 [Zea mays]